MTATIAVLGTANLGTSGTSFASSAITPTAGRVLRVTCSVSGNAASVNTLTTGAIAASQGSWTWFLYQAAPNVNTTCAIYVFYADIPAGLSGSTTFTVTGAGTPTGWTIATSEITGSSNAASVIQAGTVVNTASASPTITLTTAPVTTDLVVQGWGSRNNHVNADFTTFGFTTLTDAFQPSGASASTHVGYRSGSTSTAAQVGSLNTVSNSGVALIFPQASGTTYQGDATTAETFTATAAATRTTVVDAAAPLSFAGTANAVTTKLAGATTSLTFAATAAAANTKLAAGSTALVFSATADSTRTTLGQASAAFTAAFTADATVQHAGITADASTAETFTATAAATRTTLGQASTALTFSGTAAATRTTLAQASAAFTFGATADATVSHAGISADVASPFTYTATAAASRTTTVDAPLSLTFSGTAAAATTKLAQATTPLTVTFTSAASRTTAGQAASPFTVAFTAAATVTPAGSASGYMAGVAAVAPVMVRDRPLGPTNHGQPVTTPGMGGTNTATPAMSSARPNDPTMRGA